MLRRYSSTKIIEFLSKIINSSVGRVKSAINFIINNLKAQQSTKNQERGQKVTPKFLKVIMNVNDENNTS